MSNDLKYLEELLKIIESDKKSILLFISFSIATIVLTLKEVVFASVFAETETALIVLIKVTLALSILCFLFSSICFFLYYRRLHLNLFSIAKYILEENAKEARKMFFNSYDGLWVKHGWKYNYGSYLFWGGLTVYIFSMYCLFIVI